MSFINGILGRISPSRQSFKSWCRTYNEILEARPIKLKTLVNRRKNVNHLIDALGDKPIRSIRPVHIAVAVRDIWQTGRHFTARRVLIEAVDVFNEAILAGVIESNPAIHIKQLPARVARKRLTLNEWQAMLKVSPDDWKRRLLLLALVTGQRRSDIQKMRFSDVWDDHLHIIQQKTGKRLALPLALRLDCIDMTLADLIDDCRRYAPFSDYMLRKSNGTEVVTGSMSSAFRHLYIAGNGKWEGEGDQSSLHECRSLSERLYRKQGIDTKTLLGHSRQSMTDIYNDDRGLTRDDWTTLTL